MIKEEAKRKIFQVKEKAEILIPKRLEADLPPIDHLSKVPAWQKYEIEIWNLGENIRQLFIEHKSLRKDRELLDKIAEISLNRNAKSGRQSFILLLGNINGKLYADSLISQLEDQSVAGHIIDSIFKMKVSKYNRVIEPYCNDKTTWIRNRAKQYMKKYGC